MLTLRWRSSNRVGGLISMDEYHYAEQITFELIQKESFDSEYDTLVNGKNLTSISNIGQLCPFIDDQGILRARGRLSKADFKFDTKHPILVPSKHPATQLMMLKAHLNNYHQGVASMRHGLQQKFWILSLRNALRNIKIRCVPCSKYNAVVQAPIMADVPKKERRKLTSVLPMLESIIFGP